MTILTGPNPTPVGSLLKISCWLIFVGTVVGPCQLIALQTNQSTDQSRAEFHSKLESLAAKCIEQKMPAEAELARRLILERDPNRQYIFMPPAKSDPLPDDASEMQKSFHKRLAEIKKEYASEIFRAAILSAEEDVGVSAYQLLHETLVYEPDHQRARSALGFRNHHELGWVRSAKPTRANEARKRQKIIGWDRGTYWEINSPHFKIASAAGEEAGKKLAAELELTYWVWRQVFFDYWGNNRYLKEWLEGSAKDKSSSRQYNVILFRDRQHYLTELADVPGVEISSGYYDEQKKASFFYAADSPPVDTWRHESIHQFLQENAGRNKTVADRGHAWMVEGIAMYFESMKVHGDVVTLGGFDAERLQYARLRCKREGFFVPLQELDAMDRDDLKTHPEIRAIYSQGSGISQFLFAANNGRYRPGFISFIKEFYKERSVTSTLAEHTAELDQIDRGYKEFLGITSTELQYPLFLSTVSTATGLALGRSGLTDVDVRFLKQCKDLDWLELSENQIGDDAVACLVNMTSITQLFLDVTMITDASSPILAKLKTLQELDLASTRFTDAGISALKDLPELQILWLANSQVTDQCINDLAGIHKLKLVDLRQTKVTAAGVKKLQSLLPDAKIMHQ